MIFDVRRASGFPLVLENRDLDILDALEYEGRFLELEHFEKALRDSDELKELKVQATKLEEIMMFVGSLNHSGPITIDFRRHLIVIEDTGVVDQ